jgi:hypothetical protein
MPGLVGVTEIDTSDDRLTFRLLDPHILPQDALIVVVPSDLAPTYPEDWVVDAVASEETPDITAAVPFDVTEATFVSEELQSAIAVKSFVELSE